MHLSKVSAGWDTWLLALSTCSCLRGGGGALLPIVTVLLVKDLPNTDNS